MGSSCIAGHQFHGFFMYCWPPIPWVLHVLLATNSMGSSCIAGHQFNGFFMYCWPPIPWVLHVLLATNSMGSSCIAGHQFHGFFMYCWPPIPWVLHVVLATNSMGSSCSAGHQFHGFLLLLSLFLFSFAIAWLLVVICKHLLYHRRRAIPARIKALYNHAGLGVDCALQQRHAHLKNAWLYLPLDQPHYTLLRD